MFDQAVSDSHPVRAATLSGNNDKAMKLMREAFDPELLKGRQALIDLADELQATVDQRSEELTARTHRTILITWIVIALGLVASFTIALSIVQVEVVKVVSVIPQPDSGRGGRPAGPADRESRIVLMRLAR